MLSLADGRSSSCVAAAGLCLSRSAAASPASFFRRIFLIVIFCLLRWSFVAILGDLVFHRLFSKFPLLSSSVSSSSSILSSFLDFCLRFLHHCFFHLLLLILSSHSSMALSSAFPSSIFSSFYLPSFSVFYLCFTPLLLFDLLFFHFHPLSSVIHRLR